jgi:hypothetical protein
MSPGERAALEGLLAQSRPALSVEIGTAEGGSLDRIAAYSAEVHSIDLFPERSLPDQPEHVHLHTGDSREVLPRLLKEFARQGRNVDFALVDGEHTAQGVKADVVNLLSSPAVGRTIIALHDTMNEAVRVGLHDVDFASFAKVSYVELDFLPGYMAREGAFAEQLWGGLGLVLVDAEAGDRPEGSVFEEHRYDAYSLIRRLGGSLGGGEGAGEAGARDYVDRRIQTLSDELEGTRRALEEMRRSASWRITAPLRAVKGALRRRSG